LDEKALEIQFFVSSYDAVGRFESVVGFKPLDQKASHL